VTTSRPFVFIANHPAVDFVNTERVEAEQRIELLHSSADLWRWARRTGVSGPAPRAGAGGRLHRGVRPLRAALRALFESSSGGRAPPRGALAVLNAALRGAPRPAPVVFRAGRFRRAASAPVTVSQLLAAIAEAAARLLVSEELGRLHRCANLGCILFFVDRSRGARRRWCSMEVCGNRAKVAAHHRRAQRASASAQQAGRAPWDNRR
jgi:predicted RNA-binding Zn ribbon-like protein